MCVVGILSIRLVRARADQDLSRHIYKARCSIILILMMGALEG